MLTAIATATLLTAGLAMDERSQDSVLGGSEYTKLPETWELSYDIAIKPYLDDYKRCLEHTNLMFNGTPNVETQHRAALPRCAEVREEGVAASNAAVARRGRSDTFTPTQVSEAFDVMGYIHIQRGRNLDQQFTLQMRAAEERQRQYDAQIAARDAALARDSEAAEIETAPLPPQEPTDVGN